MKPICRALLLLVPCALLLASAARAAEGGAIVPFTKHGTDAELAAGTETTGRAWSAEQLATLSNGLILTALPAWSAGTDYAEDDAVSHNGSSWFAQTNPTTGEEPGVANDWTLIAEKGDTGATGATGSTGATGAAGDSAYVYIAYASDATGTDFTTTFDGGLDYIAVLTTDTAIPSPAVGDFAGLWFNYKGPEGLSILNGSGAPNDANGNNGDLYFRHTGDVYVKAAGTWGSPVFSMSDLTSLIVDTLTVTTLNMTSLIFEGATADAFETTLGVVDPTADRAINLPDAAGTLVVSTGNVATATALETTRTIGGSNFNGSANVTSFPSPGAIGGSTPAAGTFTTLQANTSINLQEGAPIVLDAAGSADGAYSGITRAGTAGATLAFGDLVVLDVTDSRWELADSNSAAAADGDARGLIGICVLAAASDGSATTILLHGIVRADAAFPTMTVTAPVFISETAGDVTSTSPTTEDAVVRVLGWATTADELYFAPAASFLVYDVP